MSKREVKSKIQRIDCIASNLVQTIKVVGAENIEELVTVHGGSTIGTRWVDKFIIYYKETIDEQM